jgi:two-component system NtrC family sensor kinase
MAENKRVVLSSEQIAATALVLADQTKLPQVFFNLLENAGHNTPKDSKIRFHLMDPDSDDSGNAMVTVLIIDEGRGISADKITRIFDPFYSDRKGGTGLGLALVKHFTENMGGTVRIWNNDPPPGCTAEIRIPLASGDKEEHT